MYALQEHVSGSAPAREMCPYLCDSEVRSHSRDVLRRAHKELHVVFRSVRRTCATVPRDVSNFIPPRRMFLVERQPALSPTKRPQMDRLQDYHTVVIYSLLGCCLAALICSLSIALLILLKRCRGAETKTASFRGQEPNEYADRSSKDPLVETVLPKESSVAKGKPRPTETCIYCFPELRMAGRIEGKQTETPLVFQQAAPTTSPTTATSIPPSTLDKDRTIKIICSPSQTTSSFEIAAQH
ncbi:tumor necrosis factor receptor superfamily member 13B isoform X2 [Lepisosteus oculatus]|uniref:tumor necrosis factor receptor superfamily member 13B isoform X2 n=1 Tax=Lepisosteus oculatus TaxID=7918 RepID=UPI0035F512BD